MNKIWFLAVICLGLAACGNSPLTPTEICANPGVIKVAKSLITNPFKVPESQVKIDPTAEFNMIGGKATSEPNSYQCLMVVRTSSSLPGEGASFLFLLRMMGESFYLSQMRS